MPRPILSLALALLLPACGGGGERKDDAAVVVSTIGAAAGPADPNADPLDTSARTWLAATAQGLVRFDAAGGIEPGLAKQWAVLPDGLSYIFRLDEAEWPDGEPVTAEEVVRSLRRAITSRSRNPLAPFLGAIDEIVEMTPQVVEVRLKRPRPDLLKLFAQPELAIFRSPRFEGSGPFRAERRGNAQLLAPVRDLAAVEDVATPRPAQMIELHGERAALAIARFRAGKSDLVLGGGFADRPILDAAGIAPANIRIDPAAGLFGLAVARREGFLADAANRAAIAMAIDREALVDAVEPDWAPIETLLPAQLDSAAAPAPPDWVGLPLAARRDNARAAVAAWRRAHPEPLRIRVALPPGPGATLVWGHVAEALLSIGASPERVGTGNEAELVLIDAVAPYDGARWYLANACQPCAPDAAALIEAARAAPDLPARAQRIAQADAALTADAAYIPIAQPLRWSIVALRLHAWQGNARARHPLNHLRNEPE